MKHILFFFFIQTAVLVTWFHFPFTTVWKINFNQLLFSFCKAQYYQFLNVGFLGYLFIEESTRLLNMLSFARRRADWVALLVILFYVSLIVVFLLPLNIVFLYKGAIVVIALLLAFFPSLLPKELIKNPKGLQKDEFNFQLSGKLGQRLPISNPLAGIYIAGIQGSGKTDSVVNPILIKMIQKGYSGILYDFKFAINEYSLTHLVYRCLQVFKAQNKSKFISINFQDPKTSSRFNPIDPTFIKDRKTLSEYIDIFLYNLNTEEAEKKDFWYKNTFVLMMSIVIFLNNQYPSFCTLPHAFLMGMQPFDNLLAALKSDDEASMYASAAEDAFKRAPEQFTGVISSFKILLLKMLDKQICWVLGANQVPVIVNDRNNPLIVCLGNTATQTNFTSPILVMITAVLLSNMYAPKRNKSFLMIDELPMFKLPNLAQVPAIARSFGISTVVALQDMAQLIEKYGRDKANTIQNIFDNYLFGRSSLEGAEYVNRFMGKVEQAVTSTTKSDKQTSVNTHKKEVPVITPQAVMSLKTGEFVGKVVHPSGGFFRMHLSPTKSYDKRLTEKYFQPLPVIHEEVDIEENFRKLKREVAKILEPFQSKVA